ncbi:MAG: hypothetical protein Q4C09_03725 [Atopobiaceae bacterium]|nr:hypothetical protein [Atopobiaceae bacterium]
MSLIDTIKAARQEAEEAGTIPGSKKDAAAADNATSSETSTNTSSSSGFSRKSAARAKPTREAAGSVRVTSSDKPDTKNMTKEEKKALQQERRAEEDMMVDAKRILLEQNEEYRRSQKIWWALLIAGMALSLISFLIMRQIQNTENPSQSMAFLSGGTMVLAYICIIGAFIFDMWKVRPMRNAADDRVTGMSKKRLRQLVSENQKSKAKK